MSTSEDKVADIHQQVKSPDQATDNKLHIFISHKIVDKELAEIVKKKLTSYGYPRMEIFLSEEIPYGKNWNDEIHAALRRADWLIFIYTDPSREWDWCLYEIGYFARQTQTGIASRLVCLHAIDTTIPAPLHGWQAVEATEKNIKKLLKQIYTEAPREGVPAVRPDAAGEDASEWLTEVAGLVATSLKPAPKIQCYSKFLKLSLNETQINQFIENGKTVIPDDAIIDGNFDGNALSLFDLNRGNYEWSEFSEHLKEHNQDSWIGALCGLLPKIIRGSNIIHQQSLPTFISAQDHRFFVPVIHRLEQVGGRELKLWLLFLPTSTPPLQVVTHTHPYIRLSYGDNSQIVAASPEAEKLYGQSPLTGTSLEKIIDILTNNMMDSQKTAFMKEQGELIVQLFGGSKSLNAKVCLVFTKQPDKAYLPMITKYFKRQDERYIDVIYLDVSNIAKVNENGIKTCELI